MVPFDRIDIVQHFPQSVTGILRGLEYTYTMLLSRSAVLLSVDIRCMDRCVRRIITLRVDDVRCSGSGDSLRAIRSRLRWVAGSRIVDLSQRVRGAAFSGGLGRRHDGCLA